MGYFPYARIVYGFAIPDSLKTDKQIRIDLDGEGCEVGVTGPIRSLNPDNCHNICVGVLLAAVGRHPFVRRGREEENPWPTPGNTSLPIEAFDEKVLEEKLAPILPVIREILGDEVVDKQTPRIFLLGGYIYL